MRLAHILLLALSILVGLTLLPLLWWNGLEIDKARFTEEWYKACVRLLEIMVVFVLASVLWERHKVETARSSVDRRRESVAGVWREACAELGRSLAELVHAKDKSNSKGFGEAKGAVLEAFRQLHGLADEWDADEFTNIPPSVRRPVTWFQREATTQIKCLRSRLETGEIIMGRALSEDDQRAFKNLHEFASAGYLVTKV